MRDLWDRGALKAGKGFVIKPKKLTSSGIKRLIERAIWAMVLKNSKMERKDTHSQKFTALVNGLKLGMR